VIEGKEVYRPYTPTSSDDDLGHFDLVIKVRGLADSPYRSLCVMCMHYVEECGWG
jgi:hypothetical protein